MVIQANATLEQADYAQNARDTPKRAHRNEDFLGLQPHLNAMSGDADAAVACHYHNVLTDRRRCAIAPPLIVH